jgi:hypothetical protein
VSAPAPRLADAATVEVRLVLLPGWVFDRRPDAATGLLEMVVKPG